LLFNAQYETTQMLESVKLAIREAQRFADAIVLSPVDIVLPGANIYRTLVRRVYEADCIRPAYKGKCGHPVLIGKGAFSGILAYGGAEGLKGALRDAGATVAIADVNNPGILMDADTPDDYREILQQLESEKEYIVVAGGLNIDIGGTSQKPLIRNDSNPGSVRITSGGVGRNIAHNLSLLKQHVFLLSAYGDDHYRELIEQQADAAGLDLSHAIVSKKKGTATYLFINECDGNMDVAINDMEICSYLTPDYFAQHIDLINGAKLLVMDANLPEESIAYLTEHVKVPVFADMVSVTKAKRFVPYLSKLHTIKPNALEAEALSGITIKDDASLKQAGEKLHSLGVKNVFLSTGGHGMLVINDETEAIVPACKAEPVNMTGAGDACMAALAMSYIQGEDAIRSAQNANAAAAITIESMYTISEKISDEEVAARVADNYGENRD
ncbi:MAG: bifunctional hydroxymethylpyrimidine kinase/phosphomethylpyrimidine kinase, partial [Lachnospiraceae bacterium]|nr:bifunctional hydroxymethylpyrimidine kinase/phosphomethylpyrimidine kinase [Lachnospiraceae bacterium]